MKSHGPILLLLILFFAVAAKAEDGYKLWLRYAPVQQGPELNRYRQLAGYITITGEGPTQAAIRREMSTALPAMLGTTPGFSSVAGAQPGIHFVLDPQAGIGYQHPWQKEQCFSVKYSEGANGGDRIIVSSPSAIGLLYGSFYLLRQMAMQIPVGQWPTITAPAIRWRMLNHWDNLNRYVERGYAGISIFNWHTLPGDTDQRYTDYARANASVGINAVALTNVNANATVLTDQYIEKVKALADIFRPYGIRVFLTARFSAPIELDKLPTADPTDAQVAAWWQQKAAAIYKAIPDFGGFLVKANSEGQPGPQNYGRNHADGANMMARAVAPFGGIVIWRAFVYSNETPEDRFKQAYNEFVPLDEKFDSNVVIQVKNGPIDFQPREPFHPLFGALPHTQTAMEFQLTQEYLGFATHLVYLAPMFREVLDADTYRPQQGSTVANVITGKSYAYNHTVMAGVANIGNDINWCGHPFAQANWYLLGRLAWNPAANAETIAREWIQQTLTQDAGAINTISKIMLGSHEAVVNYMTPLGLHHIMGNGHHYGPAPWFNSAPREDWNCTYFHRADAKGIGFDRTSTGSNAIAQYATYWQRQWESVGTTDTRYLLWFHHVPWNYTLANGRTLWDQMGVQYQQGVDAVAAMQKQWESVAASVDTQQHQKVSRLLSIQLSEAKWWRDACLLYFQPFSGNPYPKGAAPPLQSLDYYKNLRFPNAPGNGQ